MHVEHTDRRFNVDTLRTADDTLCGTCSWNFRACPVLFQSQVCVWQRQLHPLRLRLCLNSSWINCRELRDSLPVVFGKLGGH